MNRSRLESDDLYVANADKAGPNDKADVFLVYSTDGGGSWHGPQRVNTDTTSIDQWMPVMGIKPDGNRIFLAWCDRRLDTANNSLIDLFGRFGTIASDGSVSFTPDFRITTASFPPVFAGTLSGSPYTDPGGYDPVYPPGGLNLHWWYPDWPLVGPFGELVLTSATYIRHVGEYNGAWAEGAWIYLTWTDYRLQSSGTQYHRHQSDIRMVRLNWPQ